jgi:hypothetical protein
MNREAVLSVYRPLPQTGTASSGEHSIFEHRNGKLLNFSAYYCRLEIFWRVRCSLVKQKEMYFKSLATRLTGQDLCWRVMRGGQAVFAFRGSLDAGRSFAPAS